MRSLFRLFVLTAVLISSGNIQAQPSNPIWEKLENIPAQRQFKEPRIRPEKFRATRLNEQSLRLTLNRALLEVPGQKIKGDAEISLPMPDGTFQRFRFVESPVMAPELAAKFPEIKTYLGEGVDDQAATIRFDLTPKGFHAQIFSPHGAVYIDPYFSDDSELHVSYYKRDYPRQPDGFNCLVNAPNENQPAMRTVAERSGTVLRTYRLACAATGEYTQFHGGTVSAAMSAIVTAVNRVNQVYENEVSVRMVLVANNDLVIYTNGNTDPYTNNDGSKMLGQNQSTLDSVIGSANYDIGHVFSTGGGGVAYLRSVCSSSLKAGGVTGLPAPTGDPFYIDYVAHEMGHQYGGNHTFNSATGSCAGGNRNASTAYEPGSGSTIQAYAGICGADNLQANSDPYFHSISFDEIVSFITGSGNACAAQSATGNSVPMVSAGPNYSIPRSTPFVLTASGSDLNGDVLTYCWEERDLGAAQALSDADNGSSPLFRSFNPTTSPSRVFPKLSSILANASSLGEKLPTTTRTMNFRVTARDNRAGGGGVNTSDMQVSVVSSAGPFLVTAPNSNVVLSGVQTVTWNVAGTTVSPINAANVNILLSTNGGLDFPIVLKSNTPNDGAESVLLPNIFTSVARIKVEAAGNIFFDVSDSNFSIRTITLDSAVLTAESCAPNNAIDPGETVTLEVALANIGSLNAADVSATLLSVGGVNAITSTQNYGQLNVGGAAVSRPFTFTANGPCGGQGFAVFEIREGTVLLGTLTNAFPFGALFLQTISSSNSTVIKVPNSGNFGNGSPYPSAISFSGVTGTVTKVTVTLSNVTHTFPDDIDILLVGPNGQGVLLMSDAGGGGNINNVTLTFDDSAASFLPDASQIVSGTYKPSNYDSSDSFSSPAPAGPYGASLAVFNGMSPNGTWSLYAVDDANPNKGTINDGWSITITKSVPNCCIGNTPPTLSAINNQVTNEDVPVAVLFSVNDAETPPGNLVVNASSSNTILLPNGNISIISNGTNRTMNLAPATNQFGNSTITVSVSDGVASVTNSFLFTVNPVNDAPVLATIANRTINEHFLLLITNSATDIDTPSGQLSFSLGTNAPAGAVVHPATGVFSWTPSEAQGPGIYTITVIVADNDSPNLTDAKNFQVTVNEVNAAPVLAAITNQIIHAGSTLVLTNNATDSDLPTNTLNFSFLSAPLTANIGAANGIFSWTPSDSDADTTNEITIQVTDNGAPNLSDSQQFTVSVVPRPLQAISLIGTNVVISWNAIAGNLYRVQMTTNLTDIDWVTLDEVTASGVNATANDSVGDQEKYYRILVP